MKYIIVGSIFGMVMFSIIIYITIHASVDIRYLLSPGSSQTIKTGDENVFQPLISQFCQHAQPEPRLFVLLYPHYQQHLVAFGIDYEH